MSRGNPKWEGEKFRRALLASADDGLRRVSSDIAEDVEESMQRTRLRGGLITPGTPTRRQPASKPGFPPAPKTGRLRGSITNARIRVLQWAVGTNVFYGLLHELGVGKLPKRPFLAPQLLGIQKRHRAFVRAASRSLARRVGRG